MRFASISPWVLICLAISLIVTVAVTPILDTWIQSIDANFIEEVKVADSSETESEHSVLQFVFLSSFENVDLFSGFRCFNLLETSFTVFVESTENSPRGPPRSIA